MDDRIIICRKDGFLVSALIRGKECVHLSVSEANTHFRVGNVYIGRVASVVPNLSACFADIGAGTNVYIPLDKTTDAVTFPVHADGKLHEGDCILLQIDRLPSKNKPASGTGEISLVGNAVCILHGRKGISFSKKIEKPGFRDTIRKAFEGRTEEGFGVMLRTNSVFFETDRIVAEYDRLLASYREIKRKFACGKPGTLVWEGLAEHLTAFRDEHLSDLEEIVTDDESTYKQLKEYFTDFLPELSGKLRFYDSEKVSLYRLYDLGKAFHDALSRVVPLRSGGSLVIDRTEAMTVIDVNSGKGSGTRKKNALHEINLEAAKEIARQLRLRNLSGMILCDFISTEGANDAEELMKELRSCTAEDRDTCVVDITALGIVEMTRVKKEVPLFETVRNLGFKA
ncbi:MAG: ribonuclease E/G [Lachnospiraceae bacterium]|nr:ribonuclease E/G [Lachnospiraceae bacterium]